MSKITKQIGWSTEAKLLYQILQQLQQLTRIVGQSITTTTTTTAP